MAAAHASRAPGFAERGRGEDYRDRDRDRLWLLGIGPLCGRLPVTIRRIALGRSASNPRRRKTGQLAPVIGAWPIALLAGAGAALYVLPFMPHFRSTFL